MKRLTCCMWIMIGIGVSCIAQAEDSTLFETNRVQLWQRSKEVSMADADKCRYIDKVPVIQATIRTSKLATALTDILYYMNTVETNGACLFTALSAMLSSEPGNVDKTQLGGLGLNVDANDTQAMGLKNNVAVLLMESLGERLVKMQQEEFAASVQTRDAIDVGAAANGQKFIPGGPFGVKYSRVVAKYVGPSVETNSVLAGITNFAGSRGYRFEIETKPNPNFSDIQSTIRRGYPLLLQCGTNSSFAVTGYLSDQGKNYLIVHDVVTAECKFGKTGMNEIIAEDNIGRLNAAILPGIQFIREDRLPSVRWSLVIVKAWRDLSEMRKTIIDNNGEVAQ